MTQAPQLKVKLDHNDILTLIELMEDIQDDPDGFLSELEKQVLEKLKAIRELQKRAYRMKQLAE